MFIYKTTNLVNGLIYVGLHTKNNPKYLGSGTLLVKAVVEFGRHNFKRIILEECETRGHLNAREKYWIKKLDAMNPLVGYNLLPGGNSRGFKREVRRSKAEIFKDLRPIISNKIIDKHFADNCPTAFIDPCLSSFVLLTNELKEIITESVKSGQWSVLSVKSNDGVKHEFASPGEMISFYAEVKALALAEEDLHTPTYRPITMRESGGFRRSGDYKNTSEAEEIRNIAFDGQENLANELIKKGATPAEAAAAFISKAREDSCAPIYTPIAIRKLGGFRR